MAGCVSPFRQCQRTVQTSAASDKAFSGIGGVTDFRQAASYFLLGCGTVQVCTAAMLDKAVGPTVIKNLKEGLAQFIEKNADKGFKSVEDFRGLPGVDLVLREIEQIRKGGDPHCDTT